MPLMILGAATLVQDSVASDHTSAITALLVCLRSLLEIFNAERERLAHTYQTRQHDANRSSLG